MATTTPSPPPSPPHEEPENHNLQPLISAATPPSPIEDVDRHQQFANSNSPNSPPQTSVSQQPENPVDRQHPPPEDVEDQQEPPVLPSPPSEEKTIDREQTPAPPSFSLHSQPPLPTPIGDEHPPENVNPNPNHESPLSKQSLSPSTPPTRPEDPVEIANYSNNPNQDHKSPSPSSPPPGPQDHVEIPNYGNNPNPNQDRKSPSQNSPPPRPQDPMKNPNYRDKPNQDHQDHESPSPSSPPPQSPSQSPSATTTLHENPSPKADESPKDPYSSPPPTADSPSSPQDTPEPDIDLIPIPAPPIGVPFLLHTVATSSPSKPQASPWTHPETANLIQAYQEKWYSVKKGPLKASQWEEVAITVAVRCGYDEPTKTAKQCRHKIEKLRKRYRSERGKPRSKATTWNFFKLMDNLEKGPLPISSSQPMELVELIEYHNPSSSNGKKRKTNDSDGEFLVNKRNSRSKSSNHHITNGGLTGNLRFSDGGSERVIRGLRTPMVHKHKGFYQEDNGDEEEEEEEEEEVDGSDDDDEEEEEGVAVQLAAEIKGFAERFVKMENKKIEMIRDTEKYRLEMENKRLEMILESRKMLLEIVNKAFNSSSHKTTQKKLSAN